MGGFDWSKFYRERGLKKEIERLTVRAQSDPTLFALGRFLKRLAKNGVMPSQARYENNRPHAFPHAWEICRRYAEWDVIAAWCSLIPWQRLQVPRPRRQRGIPERWGKGGEVWGEMRIVRGPLPGRFVPLPLDRHRRARLHTAESCRNPLRAQSA